MTKRHLQIALGLLWMLDGLLQLQPKMFTGAFAKNVIIPAASGQPAIVSSPMHWAASIFLLSPVLFNSLIALTQLLIGILIINKRTVRYGLIASIMWGTLVWVIGEGYGGLFGSQPSLIMGLPGAALLYVILSIVSYPSIKDDKPAYWLAFVWSGVWILGAIFLLVNQPSAASLKSMALANASGAPSWLTSVDNHVGSFVGGLSGSGNISSATMHGMAMPVSSSHNGYWFIILIALMEMAIAAGIFIKGYTRKFTIILSLILLCIFWLVGQSAAGYYSGVMTDPNSAPILMLIGVVLLLTDIDVQLASFGSKVAEWLT